MRQSTIAASGRVNLEDDPRQRVAVRGDAGVYGDDRAAAILLDSHETKPGVWAKIVVLEGSLRYCILGPEAEEQELTPARPGVAEPEVPHRVEITGPVRFQLELYR